VAVLCGSAALASVADGAQYCMGLTQRAKTLRRSRSAGSPFALPVRTLRILNLLSRIACGEVRAESASRTYRNFIGLPSPTATRQHMSNLVAGRIAPPSAEHSGSPKIGARTFEPAPPACLLRCSSAPAHCPG
jgi:hypothetical protein